MSHPLSRGDQGLGREGRNLLAPWIPLLTPSALSPALFTQTPPPSHSPAPHVSQQPYVSVAQQMAPPSPGGSNSGGGGGGDQLSKTNLYIRGLHPATTDQDLVKLCQP